MKFDIVLMNPPYDENSNGDQFYVKFVNKVLKISYKAIIITPDTAFLSKAKSKNKELKENINKYKPELYISDWKEFVGVHPNSRCCISVFNKNKNNDKIKVIINGKSHLFNSQDEINLNDNEYLEEFYNKIKKYFENHKSFYDYLIANPKNKRYFLKKGREKIKEETDKKCWYFYMPYIVASHYTTYGYKKYSDDFWNGSPRVMIKFDNENEAKNCYKTVCVENGKRGELNDFYKLILQLIQVNMISPFTRYDYFPYLDFSKEWTDEELFKMIGMKYNKEEIYKILKNNV